LNEFLRESRWLKSIVLLGATLTLIRLKFRGKKPRKPLKVGWILGLEAACAILPSEEG